MSVRRSSRILLKALMALTALSLTSLAPAQETYGVCPPQQASRQYEAICSAGVQVLVERYNPPFAGRFPAVVMLHGVDGVSGRYGQVYRMAAQQLASSGYVVFLPHYFHSTGTPANIDIAQMSPQEFMAWMRAASDTISYAAAQPNVDSRRIGLFGFSLGSYLALSVGSVDRRVSAVVEFAGGLPEQFAAKAKNLPPTLIIHGERDQVVPVTQAYELSRLLSKRGVAHNTLIYPGQDHALDEQVQADAAARIQAFLARNL